MLHDHVGADQRVGPGQTQTRGSDGFAPMPLIAAVAHGVVACVYRYWGGMSITSDPGRNTWDWFWQTAPMDLLRDAPCETIVYFHAQPPLYNILGAVLGRVFYPDHLAALYTLYIILGTLMVLMSGFLLQYLIPQPIIRHVTLFVIAFFPALFVYEAYILYTQLSAFWVLLSIFWIMRYQKTRQVRYLYLFVITLNLLILTRSLFHPIWLLIVLFILPLLVETQRRRVVIVSAGINLLTVVFLLKNLVVFGFFGLSSWSGMNFYNIVEKERSDSELQSLVETGVLDPVVVEVDVFSRPSKYIAYGFTETSDIPVLRRDDRNNINYIDISNTYGRNALALLKHDPATYLLNVGKAYMLYTYPSARFKHTVLNAEKMGLHEQLYNVFLGTGISFDRGIIRIFPVWAMPLTLLAYVYDAFNRLRRTAWAWRAYLRQDTTLVFMFGLIVYGLIMGIFFEFGENERFKYLTEIPLIMLAAAMMARVFAGEYGVNRWARRGDA
ncbi:MAG: hypothetical protein JXA10_06130 [Anaerolineae bacterium]|nr:hypothetical protein [Anaerolineae bacterium]